jgi:DNA-binding NtrC family response regulator
MGAGQDERLVLAIDDDPHVLRALDRVLRRGGYNVITAEGGEQALKALDGHPELALVISDYWMPGVSGADVLKAARRSNSLMPLASQSPGMPMPTPSWSA